MAKPITIATGTTDVQGVADPCTLSGYSVRESAGTAAVATVILRDGTSNSDPGKVFIELAANGSQTVLIPIITFATGIWIDRVAGETELCLYVN